MSNEDLKELRKTLATTEMTLRNYTALSMDLLRRIGELEDVLKECKELLGGES